MLLDFLGNQALYLALARGDAEPLAATLREFPDAPHGRSLGRFVRNHDELTLDKLTDDERAEVFDAFGPDPDLQLYGRGLRRRLPTMLGRRRARDPHGVLARFSLPGTPVLFYGEEIGMGENLAIEGRLSVRSPMQWSAERHGGFSTAEDAKDLRRPVTEGAFGPAHVNVAAQRRDPDSLLNWFERLIRRRRECPEIGFGKLDAARDGRAVRARPPLRLGGLDGRRGARAGRGGGGGRVCRSTTAMRSSTSSAATTTSCRRRSGSRRMRRTGSASGAATRACRPSVPASSITRPSSGGSSAPSRLVLGREKQPPAGRLPAAAAGTARS